jgi:hypothetical protein
MTDEPMTMTWPSDELGRRLAAYAVALTPRTDASARIRANVIARAAETLRPAGAWLPPVAVEPVPADLVRQRSGYDWLRRRVAVAVFAAGIGVAGVTGVVAAAAPGGALYETRLWAEALTLPTETNSRLDADVIRLDARLADARRAAETGNVNGVGASLRAYVQVLDDAVATAGPDAGRDRRIATALNRHQDVLTALEVRLPPSAMDALDRALQRTEAAIGRLEQDGSSGPGGNSDRPGAGKPTGGSGGPVATPGDSGGHGQTASPSASNHRSDRPGQTKGPAPKPSDSPPSADASLVPTPSSTADATDAHVHKAQAPEAREGSDGAAGTGSVGARWSTHTPTH